MPELIYLDHNAATPPLPEVLEVVSRVSREQYGNPGSRHAAGRKARQVLEESRETIASILDANSNEIIFTSGGTESNNLALTGLLAGRTGTILTLPGEHPSVRETLKHHSRAGSSIVELPIDHSGRLISSGLEQFDWTNLLLVTGMLAHNETGTIQDLTPLVSLCAEHRVPLHVDAVQAVGKMQVSFRQLNCTTLSLAAHKFYGPRGIGALLIKNQTRLICPLHGGHQERDLRPGTELVALAAGMATALSIWQREHVERTATVSRLRDRLEAGLQQQAAPVVVHAHPDFRLPNTLSIAFPGCQADSLLVALDLQQICCSHGSACSSGSTAPAPVLAAMGLPLELQQSTLRFSLGIQNSETHIDGAIRRIAAVVQRLRRVV